METIQSFDKYTFFPGMDNGEGAEFLSLTRLSRKFVLNGSLQCIVDFNGIRLWFKDYGSKGKAAGKRGVDGHVVTRRKLHIFAHFCSYSAVSCCCLEIL